MNRPWRFVGGGLPGVAVADWPGYLVVLEGPPGSGVATQLDRLREWLEVRGYGTAVVGGSESAVAAPLLAEARRGHPTGRTTMTLLQATDLADTVEHRIIPALQAGLVVLANRYIYAPMARDMARGGRRPWLDRLFGFALEPDAVFYLSTTPGERISRTLERWPTLDYWESGLDLGVSSDRFQSYWRYQELLQAQYTALASVYEFTAVDGSAPPEPVAEALQAHLRLLLEGGEAHDRAGASLT